jgi:surface antigen
VRWRSIALGGLGVLLGLPIAVAASTPHGSNCVAYARDVTGIKLDGNAATWWPHAEGRYERGQLPTAGAVLVFKPSPTMHVGHVAVISQVIGPREILVDQANWIRGRVTRAMSVVDSSPNNDWTLVKVLEVHSGTHGRDNPTFGFIYPKELPAQADKPVVATAAAVHQAPHERTPHDRTAHTRLAAAHPKPTATATTPATHHRVAVKHSPQRPGKPVTDKQIAAVY